jgi:DNA polymerase I
MNGRLFLIDGHALIFKMYYAFLRRPMVNSKGADMSILYGFTKYILELTEREKPTHIAVAFDPPGGTFRNKMYPLYKANRAETPRLVIDALEPLTGICRALDIPVLMVPGFEADDVIGSMSVKARNEGFEVYMVTPDKDYGQLVGDGVFQYKPGKSGGEAEILDSAAVCAKYGINSPVQVIEMLTLCGDASDNVPGVKGVGEVGAAKLISRYGTVENIYAHIGELSPRQRDQFGEAEPHIRLSHDLVTIKTDISIPVDTASMAVNMSYTPEVADLFENYEFNSLKRLIPESSGVKTVERPGRTIRTENVAIAVFRDIAVKSGALAISAEKGKGGCSVAVACIEPGSGWMDSGELPEVKVASGNAEDFRGIIESPDIIKYGIDLKRQISCLWDAGLELGGKLLDVSLMHYLLNPERSHGIDILAKSYLGAVIEGTALETEEEPAGLFDAVPADSDEGPVPETGKTAAALLVGMKIRREMEAGQSGGDGFTMSPAGLYDRMEEPLMRVLAGMERTGVKVDLTCLREFASGLRKEMNGLESQIRALAGEPELNVSSPKQVGDVLFDKLKLDPKAKKSSRGSYSTDETTLSALADRHPVVNRILEFRAVKKLLSTYIEPFPGYVSPVDGRVHTTFNQALTATGRLSSSNPNLQNIPVRTERGKEIRKAFVAGALDGCIVSADYSQIELRIMAHLSQDQHLISAFRHGEDVHRATASRIYGIPVEKVTDEQRRVAKTANFGIMYGISSFGLSQRLGISRTEAKKIIEDYFTAFPSIKSFIADTVVAARENGYVETIFGRRRYLPDINSGNATVRALAERNAVNAPIQGTSADIIKLAMIRVDEKMRQAGMKSRMVLQIHDELLFDTLPGERDELMALVKECMEGVVELSVPLTVECNYGKNWLEAH